MKSFINNDHMSPEISIIVPVYNVELYIRQCVDSIICQTFDNIEIILVDDGSTDVSGKICDEYALLDNRIRVIHKSHEGLSCARNDGIDAATASYIMFVDSDDWVDTRFCEMPYSIAKRKNCDIVLFSFNRIYKDGRRIPVVTKKTDGLKRKEEVFDMEIHTVCASWVGLYRKELFQCVKFPSHKYYEDVGTSHRIVNEAKRIWLTNEYLYNHRVRREGSIMTATETKYHPDQREMHIRRALDLYNWGYLDLARQDALGILIRYGAAGDDNNAILKIVKNGDKTKGYSWKQRTMLLILKKTTRLFDYICIAAGKRIHLRRYYF